MAKRQKATRFSIQSFDNAHYRTTEQYTSVVDVLFDAATKAISQAAAKGRIDPEKPFSFDDYPSVKAVMQEVVKQLANRLTTTIETGSRNQWLFANKKNDGFIASIMDTSKLSRARLNKMQDQNLDALKTFQGRKVEGLNLSERVWKYVGQYREQMETALDAGLGEGRSAQQLARDVKQNLQDPNRLFRRVRDKRGNLVLSKAAKAFHPGRGVYRSSVKNAQRLTRSEINMAYRESDWQRWQGLDFVVGFEIKRSNHDPLCKCDTCAKLVGRYPKWFKFKGWHPQCMCYAVPVLMDEETFDDNELGDLKAALNGTTYKAKEAKNAVVDVPDSFKEWVKEHEEAQKEVGFNPYFIKDNFKDGLLSGGLLRPAIVVPPHATGIDYSMLNDAIEDYVSGDMMWINQYLRGIGDFGELNDYEKNYLQQLTEITQIEKVGEQVLWRSVDARAIFGKMSELDWDSLQGNLIYGDTQKLTMQRVNRLMDGLIGKRITEKGFMSTTRDKTIAADWGDFTGSDFPIVMRIKTNAMTKGFDVEKYTKIHHPEVEEDSPQREVLLAMNQEMRVVGIRKEGNRICVEVELIDKAATQAKPQPQIDPIQQQLDALMPQITQARSMATKWGLSVQLSMLNKRVQDKDISNINISIAEIVAEVKRLADLMQRWMIDAIKLNNECRKAGFDSTSLEVMIKDLDNPIRWSDPNTHTIAQQKIDEVRKAFADYKERQANMTDKLNDVSDKLTKSGIVYNEVKDLPKTLTDTEIITRLCGGDLTDGSCSSLAFAYAGNRANLDVLDFRDGSSRKYFSNSGNIFEIVEKVGGVIENHTSDITKAKNLLATVVKGKEYYFTCGKHAAIVRKTERGFEYLELQSAISNGWKPLTTYTLKDRFKAQQSHSLYGTKYATRDCIVEISLLGNDKWFRKVLGYINTKESEQKKGKGGTIK